MFQGESYAECLNKILNFKSESLDHFAGTLSVSFLAFVKHLMMPRREDRFVSAAEALKALTGKEPGLPEQSSKSGMNSRILSASLVLFSLLLLAISVLHFWPAGKQDSGSGVRETKIVAADSGKKDSLALSAANGAQIPGPPAHDLQVTSHVPATSEKTNDDFRLAPRKAAPSNAIAEQVVPDSGFIQVSCTPWAKVFLGNEYLGTTPIAGSLKVRSGVHTITFNNPSFLPIIRSVTVRAGTLSTVEASFLDQVGYLLVVSQPWAEIYVDDQYRETTPLGQPLMVTSGNRKIRLHNPAFEDIITDVRIGLRDTVKLVKSFTMK
jgi:hypothetical protein